MQLKKLFIHCGRQLIVFLLLGITLNGLAQVDTLSDAEKQDSILKVAATQKFNQELKRSNHPGLSDSTSLLTLINLSAIKKAPFISVQQYLKGNAAGLYVNEESGEPGTEQFMHIRGLNMPIFNKQDLIAQQPAVFVNGVPLVQQSALTYNIQRYDFNSIGSGTNVLAALDVNNIEKIEVLKTPSDLAVLGPIASNGAIWITTKNAQSGFRKINVDTYFGILKRPSVYSINSQYENEFRDRYYQKYATLDQIQNKPLYVANTLDPNFYGPSDWTDTYYKAKPVHYIGVGLLGGMDRANFMFNISKTKDQNFDATSLNRYNIVFGINMLPAKWLTISGNVNATRMDRDRNRSLRDRFAETRFVPDLANPLAPNVDAYNRFLRKYEGSVDDNINNSFFGSFNARAKFNRLELNTRLAADYEESLRDVFYGKALMDNNNFGSVYTGFNQRFTIMNTIKYSLPLNNNAQEIRLEAGQSYVSDFIKYDYVVAYNTPNDFIKIKETYLSGDGRNFLNRNDIFGYPFTDKTKTNLSSLYGRIGYSFKKLLDLDFVGRYDGYSNFSEYARWLFTPVASARFNVHELVKSEVLSTMVLKGSWGQFGNLLADNRFKIGPQYRVDLGYSDEPTLGSYAGLAGLSQPYSFGWVNEYYNWPFSVRTNIGTEIGLYQNRILFGLDYYNNKNKNLVVPTSMPAENGFSYKYVQGMTVQNSGLNFTLNAEIIKRQKDFGWNLFGNFSWNKNKLLQLPYGLNSLVFGNKKIEVGKPVDAYWVYENKGIINNESEIPKGKLNLNGTYDPLTFSGLINFSPGDALWADNNNDGTIDENDKVLKGNALPVYTGGLGSNLTYKRFTLDFQFYMAFGHKLLNRQTSGKLDFINNENSRDISYIKEVTFWQKTFDYNDYPLYNPWSSTIPYRLDQDLFLENASYVKLRALTLGYDCSSIPYFSRAKFNKALIYVTASNLFTISSFSGGDPEQVDYMGYYNGRSLPIPKSFIIGLKLDF
ncbi:SusC/RagA family TonB-linked outer membrane protein [Niabella pedocola]|uniref:SusC/RagA family TonB-linked outer membrane protein n=1 Tax=Niabella pedocola TaxID=1752077 RepID=A0ABS8PMC6_9BACT|nr:SusC/RagA family TonB-linked outer membrane protein [Niabella pedocola]MCD2422257.1 SusC/RagA family TonB-linked outer membrane protein [Niabella pedocola]